jgi:heat shock protein HslJ
MRRKHLLASALFAWAGCASAAEPPWFAVTGEVTRILVLRGEPAATGRRVGEIPAGANGIQNKGCRGPSDASWEHLSRELREAMSKERWCRVAYRGADGWVSARFLKAGDPPEVASAAQSVAPAAAPAVRRGDPQFTGIEWRAAVIGGLEPSQSAVWLRFSQTGELTGHTGCNTLRGSFVAGATALRIAPLMLTRRACEDPARNQQEAALVAALESVETQQVEGGVLRLYDGSGGLRAVFRQGP